jgi:hypothetical protein
VSPAPLRTVSGRASRRSGASDVLGGGDVGRDAVAPGSAGRGAPGDGVGDLEQRVAVWRHVVVAACAGAMAQFADKDLSVQLVGAIARLDDESIHGAVEQRLNHLMEALGADLAGAAFTGLYCGRVFWESARPELSDVVCGDDSG